MLSTTSFKILFFFIFFLAVSTVKIVEGLPQIVAPGLVCVGLPKCETCYCFCNLYRNQINLDCEKACAPDC